MDDDELQAMIRQIDRSCKNGPSRPLAIFNAALTGFIANKDPAAYPLATIDPALMSALADGRVGELIRLVNKFKYRPHKDKSITWSQTTDVLFQEMIEALNAIQGSTET